MNVLKVLAKRLQDLKKPYRKAGLNMSEELRKENESLKLLVKQLRQELEAYKKQQRKQYDVDHDHVPYHERERD
jgi:hypothetical protein